MIRVFCENQYLFTTNEFKTIREIKKWIRDNNGVTINIASVPHKTHKIDATQKYQFERGYK